jgi:hypothetical protein
MKSMKNMLIALLTIVAATTVQAATVTFNPAGANAAVTTNDLTGATTTSGDAANAHWVEVEAVSGTSGTAGLPVNHFVDDGAGGGDFGWVCTSGNGQTIPDYRLDLGDEGFLFSSTPTTITMNFDITRGSNGRTINIIGYANNNVTPVFDMEFNPAGPDDILVDGDGDADHELLGAKNLSDNDVAFEENTGVYDTYTDSITGDITITLDGSTLIYSVLGGAYAHTTTVLNAATDLGSITFGGSAANGGGWRLDDLVVTGEVGTIEGPLPIYTAPEPLPAVGDGSMPGLMDGNDAFFTFSAVFGSFTFTPDVETNETGGVDGPDRMVLFESGGTASGISLTMDDAGLLRFRSGGTDTSVQEVTYDLPTSSLSTGTPIYVVAAFNATENTLDLYFDSTNKAATASLGGNTALAGENDYGVGARVANLGAYDRSTLDDYDFLAGAGDEYTNSTEMDDNRMFDFVVYGTLEDALSTIPQPGALLTTLVGGPSPVYEGEPVTLSWVVDPSVDSITVSPAIGGETDMLTSSTAPNGVGSIVAYPSSDTTYELVVTKGANAETGTVEIVVNPMELIDFSASETSVYMGEAVSLSWNVAGAESISIDLGASNIITTATGSGSVDVVQPLGTNTYVLTASNRFSTVTGQVVVVAEFAASLTTVIDASFANGNGGFEFDALGAALTNDYATPGLWQAGSSGLGSAANQGVDHVEARNNAGVAEGSFALAIGGLSPDTNLWSGGILNTEYVIQEGDRFDFSFWLDPLAGWDNTESLDVILFTSSDDTLGGSLTAVMVTNIADGATDITEYTYTIPEMGEGNPHIGKKLWVEFSGVQENVTKTAHARVDDVRLKAVSNVVLATPAELSVSISAGQIRINAENLALGAVYQIQWTDNLVFPDWTDIGDPITGGTSAMQDLPTTNPAAFYRVISR